MYSTYTLKYIKSITNTHKEMNMILVRQHQPSTHSDDGKVKMYENMSI